MTDRILFDVSRLVERVHRGTPTGIDRVCLAYARWLLAEHSSRAVFVRRRKEALYVLSRAWLEPRLALMEERWTSIDHALGPKLEARIAQAFGERSPKGREALRIEVGADAEKAVRSVSLRLGSRQRLTGGARDTYLNVSHTGLERPALLRDLKASGVRVMVMVHDIIPLTHPEFCREGDREKHAARIDTVARYVDAVIANSQATADALTGYLARRAMPVPEIHVARLGVRLPPSSSSLTIKDAAPYFVHVGTLEGRKNLAFLLSLWRRLDEEFSEGLPHLVLIGRMGWEHQTVKAQLDRGAAARRWVHHLEGAPDDVLMRLVSGARGLLSPSFAEGFNLPAVEASALGTPVIASDIPAHRELLPGATLLDPLDGEGWRREVLRLASARERPSPVAAPTWDDHFGRISKLIGGGRSSARPRLSEPIPAP